MRARRKPPPALERAFDAEKIRKIMIHEIDKCVGHEKYDQSKSQHLVNEITMRIFNKLCPHGETNFKYSIHCIITDNRMQDYDCFSNALWEDATDGVAVVDFANADIRCCVTLWGVRA